MLPWQYEYGRAQWRWSHAFWLAQLLATYAAVFFLLATALQLIDIEMPFKRLLSGAGLALATVSAQSTCPGYNVLNVQQSSNGLTADLQLAGAACNVYGIDLSNLTLTVEYQTGMSFKTCE